MYPECPYSNHHGCTIWLDYQVALLAVEDAAELAQENWDEISFLLGRVEQLERLLRSAGIEVPSAYCVLKEQRLFKASSLKMNEFINCPLWTDNHKMAFWSRGAQQSGKPALMSLKGALFFLTMRTN